MKEDLNSLIIYEDAQIIVCRKPAGIAVQSARPAEKDLESLLKNYLAASQTQGSRGGRSRSARTAQGQRTCPAGSSAPYLAVIHRLDQPVEGLLVFAKTPQAARDLNRQLTSSVFGKYYRAVVSRTPDPLEGTLQDYLVKDARSNSSRVCGKDTPGAKEACLHYKTVETYSDSGTSLVEIKLDTGRHHQIRVQMSHIGCPLAGDYKYGYKSEKNAEPLRLCAYKLCFKHPLDKRNLTFELP